MPKSEEQVKLARVEKSLRAKFPKKVVRGSISRIDGKICCRIRTEGLDGRITRRRDARGRFLPHLTICTSDVFQVIMRLRNMSHA